MWSSVVGGNVARAKIVTAESGAEGLAAAHEAGPDVVLLDLSFKDADGFDLIGSLRSNPKPPAIIVFTGKCDAGTVRKIKQAGVAGVFSKLDSAGSAWVTAVREVLAGGVYVSAGFSTKIAVSDLVAVRPVAAESPPPERIVVVKWDRLIAEVIAGLVREVRPAADIRILRRADEARRTLRDNPADLGLFGLTFPDGDGLDLIAELARERRARRILVVSGRRDERTRYCLRHAPIDGFYDCGVGEVEGLRDAVGRVAGGGRWFFLELLAASSPGTPRLHGLLPPVELQVFAVLGNGADDRRAAERLGMNVHTLHKHRSHIMDKLGLHTRTELVNAARRFGMVRFSPEGAPFLPRI